MINQKTLWLVIATTATLACSPVEYAEELGRNKIILEFPTAISGTHQLTMSLESEEKPVLVTEINTNEVSDFRGPPGWYIGELTGKISEDGKVKKIQSVLKYNEDSITRANFGALGSVVHALHKCDLNNYSVQQSIDIVQQAFGINPASQDESSSTIRDMNAINEGFRGYASELGLSYYDLMGVIMEDISTDCMLNGYSQDMATGARNLVSYNGHSKTAIELANGISANVNQAGLLDNHDVNALVHAMQHNSSQLFDDNVDVYDTEPVLITENDDLSISIFGTKDLSFSFTDIVGLDYITASILGHVIPVSYNKLNKTFQLTLDTTLFDNGTHTITINSIDMAGNTGTQLFPIIIDNLGPAVENTKQHYSVQNAQLSLIVTPPTGSVSSVSINGIDFVNTQDNVWEGFATLTDSINNLTVLVSTSFGLNVQRNITVYFDNVSPVVSALSSEYPVASISGSQSGLMNLYDIQSTASFFDLRRIPHYEFGLSLSKSEMTDKGMMIIEVYSEDGFEGNNDPNQTPEEYSTPVEKIDLSVELSVNGMIVSEKDLGFGSSILPITYDFFGNHLTTLSSSDSVALNFKATDLAGNTTSRSYTLPVYNESMTHTLSAGTGLTGSYMPMVYENGLTSDLEPISDQDWNSNQSIELGILYDHLSFDMSNLSYYNSEKGYYVEVYPNTHSMPIPMGSSDRDITIDHGISLYGAFLKADMVLNESDINSSIATGDMAFESSFEGLLTEIPYDTVNQITEYSAKANATILREAFIRASNQYESNSNFQCSAFDIEKLAAFDYADDFIVNKTANPIVDYCNDYSPYDAARLIANQEREIVNELGLLAPGNEFDINIARPHYTPVGPIALHAFDVDVYSGNLAFTPVYRSETNSYTIEMYINNEYQASYSQGEEIVIDTTAFPNGMYVVKLVMTDLYFNTTTDTFFSTFEN